jgi:hypothetical protein
MLPQSWFLRIGVRVVSLWGEKRAERTHSMHIAQCLQNVFSSKCGFCSLAKRGADAQHTHNVGASLLTQVGLGDLASDSEEGYVAAAVQAYSEKWSL